LEKLVVSTVQVVRSFRLQNVKRANRPIQRVRVARRLVKLGKGIDNEMVAVDDLLSVNGSPIAFGRPEPASVSRVPVVLNDETKAVACVLQEPTATVSAT